MAFDDLHTVILRGSTVNDSEATTAPGYLETELAVLVADAWPDSITPDIEVDGNNAIVGFFTGLRESVTFEVAPFMKSVARATVADLMDGGRVRKTIHLLSRPYVWIYRVYKRGSDVSPSALQRADFNPLFDVGSYDPEDEDTHEYYDRYWMASGQGQLPMPVYWDREGRPEHVGGGMYEWNIRLFKVDAEAVFS